MPLEPLIQKVKVEPDGVTDAFKSMARAASGFDSAARGAAGVTEEFVESADEAADSAGDVASSTSRAAQTIDKMKNSSNAAIRGMGQLAGKIRSVATAGRVLAATGIAAVLLSISSAIIKATSKAIAFENELNEVRKTAGLTESQFLDLQGSLLDIQADLGTSQDELAGIAAEAGRLGVEAPQDIATFTRTVAKMSNATVVSADEAAQGLAKLLNAFRQPVTEAERLGSVINELSNNAAANTQQIIAAVRRMGGAANQINLTANEASAFAATLQDLGVNARQSGTTLRSVFGRLLPQAEKVAEVMGTTEQQVVQAFEENGREAILSFLEELEQMDELARANAIQDLFGVRQSSRVQLLVQNMSALREQIGRAAEEAEEVNSLTAEMIETTKDVSNEWDRLTSKLSSWLADFGSNFTGMLESALSKMNELFGGAEEARRSLIEANSRLTTVEEGEALLEQFRQLQQAGEDTSKVKEDLQKAFGDEFFQETADGVEVLEKSLQQLIERRKEAAEAGLEEERRNVLQQINREVQLLQRNQARVATQEKGTPEWEEAREAVLENKSALDSLLEGLGETLPNDVEAAKERVRELIDETQFGFDIIGQPTLAEDPSQLVSRIQDAVSRARSQDEAGASSTGGAGGGAGPGFEMSEALDAQQALSDAVRQEVRRRELANAKTDEERQRLQSLFEVQDRIRSLQDQRQKLQDAMVGATSDQREEMQGVLDRSEKQLQILRKREEELQRPDAPDVPIVGEENIVAMGEELGERLKEGFPSFSELVMGEGEGFADKMSAFNDKIADLRLKLERGQISQEQFAKRSSQAARKYRQELLEIVQTLEEMGLLTPDVAKKAAEALGKVEESAESTTEETENTGKAIQDTARAVRGIGDLASQFGDLSDEADQAIRSTAAVLDNVGRLVELSGDGGFSDIFSDFSGAVSGITSIVGAAGGLAGMIQSIAADPGPDVSELRNSIREQVRALRKNTAALLEQARVGENLSENEIEAINNLIDELDAAGGDNEQILDLLTQLNETGAFEEVDLIELFKSVRDAALENVPVTQGPLNTLTPELSDAEVREFVVDILLGNKEPGDITEMVSDDANLVDEFIQSIVGALPSDFPGLEDMVDDVTENFSEFGESLEGLIREIELRRDSLGQSVSELRDVLVERMEDVGFDDPLTEGLQSVLSNLDLDDEDAVEGFIDNLTAAFVGDRDLSFLGLDGTFEQFLGEATPSDFEELLTTLEQTLLGDGTATEGEDFTTSAQIQRTITEHQANQLLSLQRELVELGRSHESLLAAMVEGVGGEVSSEGQSSMSSIGPGDLRAAFQPDGGLSGSSQGQTTERLVSKTEGGDKYIFDIGPINGDLPPRRIAEKLDEAIRRYLPRR